MTRLLLITGYVVALSVAGAALVVTAYLLSAPAGADHIYSDWDED